MKGSLSYNLFVVSGSRSSPWNAGILISVYVTNERVVQGASFGEGGPTRPQADPARQPYQGITYGIMCQGNNLSYPQLYFLFLFDKTARIWEIVLINQRKDNK